MTSETESRWHSSRPLVAGRCRRRRRAPAGTVTVKGSDTMVVLGQRWAEEYMKKNPKTVIQVTGGGSGTGISALINGTTDICEASRSMKDAGEGAARARSRRAARRDHRSPRTACRST